MLILVLDTAMAACTTALVRDDDIIAEVSVAQSHGHGEILVPQIETMLAEAGTAYGDLDLVAVTRGPGSFTGLRVGVATARAIALGTAIPVTGVTTLEALAASVPGSDRPVRVAIDSRRSDFYTQAFGPNGAALDAPRVIEPHDLIETLREEGSVLAGDAFSMLESLSGAEDVIDTGIRLPKARAIAALAKAQPEAVAPVPFYLRPADAKRPAHGGRLRP